MAGAVQIFKRKTLFLAGSFFMGAFLFALGAVLATNPIATSGGAGSPSSKGMVCYLLIFQPVQF